MQAQQYAGIQGGIGLPDYLGLRYGLCPGCNGWNLIDLCGFYMDFTWILHGFYGTYQPF